MKKVITILITLALVLSFPAMAFAEDSAMSQLRSLMDSSFPERYEIREVGRLVIIDSWGVGMMGQVLKAQLGDEECIESWNNLTSTIVSVQPKLQSLFDSQPDNKKIVIWNIVNESKHDVTWLSVSEGEVLYDTIAASELKEVGSSNKTPAATSAPTPVPEEPALTLGQKNAIGSAQSYLSFSGFSRSGLIKQLEYEGYSTEDATFAVDYLNIDWNEQAVKSAESYLSFSSFSRQGLIDQLEYEGFTHEQAVYAVGQVGY